MLEFLFSLSILCLLAGLILTIVAYNVDVKEFKRSAHIPWERQRYKEPQSKIVLSPLSTDGPTQISGFHVMSTLPGIKVVRVNTPMRRLSEKRERLKRMHVRLLRIS